MTSATAAVPRAPARPAEPPRPPAVPALAAVLRQLAGVVAVLGDEQYARKPVGVVPSSVGGHVRHCLDHVEALFGALVEGTFSYDHRARGTAVETDRRAALATIRRLERQLLDTPWTSGRRLLRLSVLVTSDGPPVEVTTTLERELAFVLSHTIHHNALIAVQATLLGVPLPPRFGYAPSTIAYRESGPCVR